MTKFITTIPATYETVVQPIILQIARTLIATTGLPKNTPVMWAGDTDKQKQPGSSFDDASKDNITDYDERVYIDIDEGFNQETLASSATMRPENISIFRDDLLQVAVRPVYSRMDMTINFRYRARDRNTATRWRDKIRNHMAMAAAQTQLHAISYSYVVPPEVMTILTEIHRMREAVAGYGEDFNTWFDKCITTKATELVTLGGNHPTPVIAETQSYVQGLFDFSAVPEKAERVDDQGDAWTSTFSYKFFFDKPIGVLMMYPLMIHNQPMDQKYREQVLPEDPQHTEQSYGLLASSLANFSAIYRKTLSDAGVQIPPIDEFVPDNVQGSTQRLMTVLADVPLPLAANPILLNLHNLGSTFRIDPVVMTFLEKEWSYITQPYKSVFVLSLYKGIHLQGPEFVSVTSGLDVKYVGTPSLREYYHVRLSIVDDLYMLPQAAADRLRDNGAALCKIAQALGETVMPAIIGDDYVTRSEFEALCARLNPSMSFSNSPRGQQFNLVQNLIVQSHLL